MFIVIIVLHTGDPGSPIPQDCREVYQRGCTRGGVYTIDPGCHNQKPFSVYCDMKNGGWIVIQRRMDGSENFYRNWADYVAGFGQLRGEHWLGLEKIHCLTTRCPRSEMRVELADFRGNYKYAQYSFFSVRNSEANYRLNIAGYTGTAGDSLGPHNGTQFSAKDRDNDQRSENCATSYKGAWWYKEAYCYESHLNGLYRSGLQRWQGVVWNGFHVGISLKYAQMKIRFRD